MPKRIDRIISYVAGEANTMISTEVLVDYVEAKSTDEVLKVGAGKTVTIQVGPTKGEAYAIFAKNSAFHEEEPDAWYKVARMALELWAGRKNYAVTTLMPEHGRPLNMRLEYSV